MKLAATTGPVSAATAFLPPSAPDEEVSFSSGGEVFDACEIVEHTFRASTTELIFIVENEGGDSLDAGILRQWKANSDALRSSDELSDELPTDFDDDLGLTISGKYSIAEAVDVELRGGDVRGLQAASDEQVRQALASWLSENRPTAGFRDFISNQAEVRTTSVESREIKFWVVIAVVTTFAVLAALNMGSKTEPSATQTDEPLSETDRIQPHHLSNVLGRGCPVRRQETARQRTGDNMRALACLRVSSTSQVDGCSLDVQERLFLEACLKQDWQAVWVYQEEGRSAHSDSVAKRPQLRQLLRGAATGEFDLSSLSQKSGLRFGPGNYSECGLIA